MSVLIAIVAFVVVLGILVLIHEFGHYAAAKLFGVRVEVFSIGFGKRLLGFRRGETDYRVSMLPLGGYVKMAGENPLEASTGDPGEFMAHPRWQRFIIAFAGPAMNILFAVALLTGVFMVHYEHPAFLDQKAVVGHVLEGSAAEKAGLHPGDRIIRIDDVQDPTWEDAIPKFALNPGLPVTVAVERNGQVITTSLTPVPTGPDQMGDPGIVPDQPITVTEINPEMPAAKAGLQVGDEIVGINGTSLRAMPSLIRFLQQNKEQPVDLTVLRAGQEVKLRVIPVLDTSNGEPRYRLGFGSNPMHVDRLPFAMAFRKSIETNWKSSGLILELLQKMVKRQISVKQLSGPVGIAGAAGAAAQQKGWIPLILLTAAISLNLAIFNLLPIPIMDGGVILLLLIESVIRRDISAQIKERIYQAAFVFLVLFAALVIYNDIAKLSGLKFLP